MAILSLVSSIAICLCRLLQSLLKMRSVLLVRPPGSTGAAQKNKKFERTYVGVSFYILAHISIHLGHIQVNDANILGSLILSTVFETETS